MVGDRGVVDTVGLSRLWDERWLSLSKLPYELRAADERWVRFHALSGSKRYPEPDQDQAVFRPAGVKSMRPNDTQHQRRLTS